MEFSDDCWEVGVEETEKMVESDALRSEGGGVSGPSETPCVVLSEVECSLGAELVAECSELKDD